MAQVFELKELKPKPPPSPASGPTATVTATKAPAPHSFRPLTDKMATRSVVLSVIGLVLFVFPVISLLGAGFGMMSLQRIRRSNGALVGERTALLGLWLGLLGVALGILAIAIFLASGG